MPHPAKPETSPDQTALLRKLPSVDELLLRAAIAALCKSVDRAYAVTGVREVVAQVRREIIAGEVDDAEVAPEAIERRIVAAVENELAPSLRPVINASGVILHTNL